MNMNLIVFFFLFKLLNIVYFLLKIIKYILTLPIKYTLLCNFSKKRERYYQKYKKKNITPKVEFFFIFLKHHYLDTLFFKKFLKISVKIIIQDEKPYLNFLINYVIFFLCYFFFYTVLLFTLWWQYSFCYWSWSFFFTLPFDGLYSIKYTQIALNSECYIDVFKFFTNFNTIFQKKFYIFLNYKIFTNNNPIFLLFFLKSHNYYVYNTTDFLTYMWFYINFLCF